MQLLVLGGFLGSGKTSQLINLAKYVIGEDENVDGAKVVILENEIGEVGVDEAERDRRRGGGQRQGEREGEGGEEGHAAEGGSHGSSFLFGGGAERGGDGEARAGVSSPAGRGRACRARP